MKLLKLPLLLFSSAILLVSCQKDEVAQQIDDPQASLKPEISKDVMSKLSNLHFNTKHVELGSMLLPDGSFQDTYLIEGDIALDANQIQNMSTSNITDKQYRTYNLVSNNRTVSVIGYTGGSQALTSKQRTALQWAVNNYNRLNIGLNFTLTFGTNYTPYDIVVYQNPNGQAGGVAGFPSNGNPYKYVQIYSGMEAYSTNTNEHVMTHEMGHAVGLRHTDWFSRQSCGQSGESAGSDGAVHIPGTPTGFDSTSIMLACFGSGEDGEFNNNDVTAIEYLY